MSDTPTSDADLIWVGGTTYALRAGESTFAWHARTAGPPTVSPPDTVTDPNVSISLAGARLFVTGTRSAVRLDTTNGLPASRYPQPVTPTGRIYPLGDGLLASGPNISYYA